MRRVVALQPDDRLDAGRAGFGVELVGPVEIAVIGHGDGLLTDLIHPSEEIIQSGRAVEHGVLGVNVQMDEVVVLLHPICHSDTPGSVFPDPAGPRPAIGTDGGQR